MKNVTGQWIGNSNKNREIVANLHQYSQGISGYVATVESIEHKNKIYTFWVWSRVEAVLEENKVKGELFNPEIWERSGIQMPAETVDFWRKEIDLELPLKTEFEGDLEGNEISVSWKSWYPTGNTDSDNATIKRSEHKESILKPYEMSWEEFKSYAVDQGEGVLFRGQAEPWRLRTSFHRTGCSDIIDYLNEYIPEVENYINSLSQHIYNARDDRSLAAMLNLLQHHGYPTPLLDWTKSPYVAAFFAFESLSHESQDGIVSIFTFEGKKWKDYAGFYANLRSPILAVRTLELPGFGNARVIPQQAALMYSNADDIEHIIKANEKEDGEFLSMVSIPKSERKVAMKELSLMGLSWGSLFPGLDGVCRHLKDKHFSRFIS